MYNKNLTQEHPEFNSPKQPIKQAELVAQVEILKTSLHRYEELIHLTRNKLLLIKKHEYIPSSPPATKEPECFTEEMERLMVWFAELNEKARENLLHLEEII